MEKKYKRKSMDENPQEMIIEFRKSGSPALYKKLLSQFKGFLSRQTEEISAMFLVPKVDVREYLLDLFSEAIVEYDESRANFAWFVSVKVKTEGRSHFRQRLEKELRTKPIKCAGELKGEDLDTLFVLDHTHDTGFATRRKVEILAAIRLADLTPKQAMVLGGVLCGVRVGDMAKVMGAGHASIIRRRNHAVRKIKAVVLGHA